MFRNKPSHFFLSGATSHFGNTLSACLSEASARSLTSTDIIGVHLLDGRQYAQFFGGRRYDSRRAALVAQTHRQCLDLLSA